MCSDHFLSGSTSALYDVANPNWAQSLKLVFETVGEANKHSRPERYKRAMNRRRVVDEDVSDGPNVLFTEERNNKSELDNTRDLL